MYVKSIAECSKGEHSAILLTFIKLPFVIKICVMSTFEWPLKTGFTVPGRGPMMWRMPLQVNQKSDYDDMMSLFTFQLPHVLVNCVECYSQRFLYEHILNHLNGELSTLVESSSLLKCENMNDFIRLLKQVLKEKGLESQTVYIVSLAGLW